MTTNIIKSALKYLVVCICMLATTGMRAQDPDYTHLSDFYDFLALKDKCNAIPENIVLPDNPTLICEIKAMESIYWCVILASGAIIILALGGMTIYYRNELKKCKTTLIRYINENIEMKEKLPEYELPNFINNEEITPSEFSKIMTNVMKRLLFIA